MATFCAHALDRVTEIYAPLPRSVILRPTLLPIRASGGWQFAPIGDIASSEPMDPPEE